MYSRYDLLLGLIAIKRALLRIVFLLLVVSGIAAAVWEAQFWYHHVYEAHARIQSNFTVLSSSVNGNVAKVHVKRGDLVEPGMLLASMKTETAHLEIRSLEADLAKTRALREQVEAERTFFISELDDRAASAKSNVQRLQDEYTVLSERLHIARRNVQRNSALQSKNVVATLRVEEAEDKMLAITTELRVLQSNITGGERQVAEVDGQRAKDAVYRSRLSVIDHDLQRIAIKVEQARQDLKDMHLYSPMHAVASEVHVNPGSYVEDGDPMILLHDPSSVWIDANIDESDIRHVKVGQRVLIEIDAYPFEEFHGHVQAIGRVTLAQITNPVDRGASTAQHIPVTIAMPAIEHPVWPGMRASVNILIR
ncbi:MAG: membrane fusion protein (multidrug efflux system) [Gammaproteobacteria bacterium]